jgi:hypothetical protein
MAILREKTDDLTQEVPMKHRYILLAAGLLLAGAGLALAADFNGKWVAQLPGRDGQTRETTFNFKVEGDKVTGTVSGMQRENPISDAKITGDEISFNVVIDAGGNQIKLVYKGKMTGDEIKFTRTREGSDRPPQEFTAKKAK